MPGLSIASPAEAATTSTLVGQIVTQTNAERAAAGCGRVALNRRLSTAAVRHSAYMASTGNFRHTGRNGASFATRSRTAGYRAAVGESIGWGFRDSAAMTAWMGSPGHRANIVNCGARSIGVGVVYAANGTPYWTQVFGRV